MFTYFYILISLVVLDSIWLLGVAKSFYTKRLGFLFKEKADMLPIIIFYLIYAFGIYLIILKPSVALGDSLSSVFLKAFIFGICAYCAYDLTNQATIANWPISVTLIDVLWGGLVTGLSATISFWLLK